jgi:hypothetical protein
MLAQTVQVFWEAMVFSSRQRPSLFTMGSTETFLYPKFHFRFFSEIGRGMSFHRLFWPSQRLVRIREWESRTILKEDLFRCIALSVPRRVSGDGGTVDRQTDPDREDSVGNALLFFYHYNNWHLDCFLFKMGSRLAGEYARRTCQVVRLETPTSVWRDGASLSRVKKEELEDGDVKCPKCQTTGWNRNYRHFRREHPKKVKPEKEVRK